MSKKTNTNKDIEVEIHKTNEYDKFKYLTFNREVNEKHVLSLMKAIKRKNLLSVSPCIISENFEIIDGQHRIEAARRLDIPFYYFIGSDLEHEDIISLNNVKKGWHILDFINFYAIKKIPKYINLTKLIVKYEWLPLPSILCLMSTDGKCRAIDAKEGTINDGNIKHFDDIASKIQDYAPYCANYTTKQFVLNIRKLILNEFEYSSREYNNVYNHEEIMDILKNNPDLNIDKILEKEEKLFGTYKFAIAIINHIKLRK